MPVLPVPPLVIPAAATPRWGQPGPPVIVSAPQPPFRGRAQVLIAWGSEPFSTSPLWTDVTPWVRLDKGVSLQLRGRQDNLTTVQSARLSLTGDNSDGRWTAGRSTSPWAPGVKIGRRVQVNVPNEGGTLHTRFDGLLTELPTAWEGGPGIVSLAAIQASDILAWLGRQPELLSWTQQEMLADSPVALWSLTDTSNATQAADQAGQGAAPLQVVSQGDGTGAAAAGSGVPLAEVLTSTVVTQPQVTATYSFTTPGSISVTFPLGTLVSCDVTCVAGGQAGATGGLSTGGAGGKSGECAREQNLAVTPGGTYTGTVGAAGVPSAGNGGDTSFAGDSVTVAAHASGSGSANSSHHSGASGGAASGANGGGGASSGGALQAGNNGVAGAGGGTAVTGGGAGGAGDTGGAGGTAGSQPGGGGGGGKAGGSPGQGGAGGAGSITIVYTYIPLPSAQQNSSIPSWLFTPGATLAARVLQGQLPQPVTAAAGFAFEIRGAFAGFPAQAVSTFTTPGPVSFTGPPGVLTADVVCTAGGQAGANGGASNGGAGGTGGESAEEPALQITPDSVYAGSVGAAGSPSGGLGGNSSFTGDLVTVLANASGSGSTNTNHHSAGSGGANNGANGGGGGSAGGTYQQGNNGLSIGSTGGTAVTGGGAGGAGDTTLAGGAPGSAPGGGGGGGKGGLGGGIAGGSGAPGQVTVTVQPSVCTLATLVNPRGQAAAAVWVTSSGHLQLASTSGYGTRSPSWTTVDAGQVPSGAFHVVVDVAAGGVATLYVNNVSAGTVALPAWASYTWVTVGGAYGSWLGGWNGSAGLAAVFPAALSSARAGVHYTAGATGFAGSSTGTMIARIASYVGLPAFWYTPPYGPADPSYGLTTVSYYDLKGQNPLSAMQQYETAEGGVLSVLASGRLTFADRASRYAAGAGGSAFVLQAGQYEPDTVFKSNDQYLITAANYATVNIPGGFPVVNAAAAADFGYYTGNAGTRVSPQSAPFADAAAAAGSYSTDDIADAGWWQANVFGTPVSRVPALTADLLTLPPAEFSIAAFYGLDIGSVIQLAGLPSQAPDAAGQPLSAYQVIEGVNETIGLQQHTAQLYTSPLSQSAAWIPGDSLLGVLGTTTTAGRSQAPAALGPPYPAPPSFGAPLNRTGSVGAQDLRTLTANTQNRLTPPLAIGQQASAQTITTLAGQAVTFDTLLADTAAGFGTPATYTIPAGFAGYYWCAAVVQAATGTGSLGGIAAWFAAVLSGVASQWHAKAVPYLSSAPYIAVAIAGRIGPCAAGDTIQVIAAAAGTPASLPLGTADGGSMFTLIWQGS